MKIISYLVVIVAIIATTTDTFSQNAEIEKRLLEYGVSADDIFNGFGGENSNYTCNAKFTEITTDKTTVSLASFDPRKAQGSRWTLESINGKVPGKMELKNFNKAHNVKVDNQNNEKYESSWEIIKDDEHFFVVGLKYTKSSLPHKYKFLAQCRAEMYVDKEAKRIYKLRFYNEGDLKFKIFKVIKLDMTVVFIQDAEDKIYLVKDEH
ncbi:MAG: hypothetical protein J7L04_14180, partial [Bacteroidales bacterium]|nr:hypothetical protein [Bacteroidales bacterium]